MRILLYGINFSPELTGIGKYTGELAEWLASRGHQIKVVTAPPYYPEWRVTVPYSASRYQFEPCGIVRCPLWVPFQPSAIKRIIHLASFAISSLPVMVAQVKWRPEVILVVEPALFCAPAALLTAKLCGSSSWLHIQDFEIDAAFELGLLKSGLARKLVEGTEVRLMQRFDRVSTISRNMIGRLKVKNVSPDRVCLFRACPVVTDIYKADTSQPCMTA